MTRFGAGAAWSSKSTKARAAAPTVPPIPTLPCRAAPGEASAAAFLLRRFWVARGGFSEARERLHTLLAPPKLPPEARASLLACLSEVEEWLAVLAGPIAPTLLC